MDKSATYTLMSGKYEWCDKCLPRGCSCNDEILFYENEENNNLEELTNNILTSNYKAKKYASELHVCGKEIEKIEDLNKLRNIVKNISIEELKKYTFIPLDENNEEYPCCEIEPKQDWDVLKTNEVVYSMKSQGWYLIKDTYPNGNFRAYPIINELPLDEYNSIEENDISKLELDYSNPIYISKDGIEYNEEIIDVYLSTYDVYGYKDSLNDKRKTLFDFLNTFIYLTQNIDFFDKKNDFNGDIGIFFEYLYDESKKTKEEKIYIKDNLTIITKELKKYFSSINESDLKEKISKRRMKILIKKLILFHYYNNLILNSMSLLFSKIENNYIKKRKEIFKKIFFLIY